MGSRIPFANEIRDETGNRIHQRANPSMESIHPRVRVHQRQYWSKIWPMNPVSYPSLPHSVYALNFEENVLERWRIRVIINCFCRQDAHCQVIARVYCERFVAKRKRKKRKKKYHGFQLHHPARLSISRPMFRSYTRGKKGIAEEVGFFGASLCFTAHKQELGAFRGE